MTNKCESNLQRILQCDWRYCKGITLCIGNLYVKSLYVKQMHCIMACVEIGNLEVYRKYIHC